MQQRKKHLLLIILFVLFLFIMILSSCAKKGEEFKNIAIAPYELSKSEKKSIFSSNGRGNAWIFSMIAQEEYNLSKCWAEVYEAGVLTKVIPVWELRRSEKETGPWVCKLGLLMNNAPSFFSWDCISIKHNSLVCFASAKEEIKVPDILEGGYEPLSDSVQLEPGEDIILLRYICHANGNLVTNRLRASHSLEALNQSGLVVLFKCCFIQSNA